MNKTNTVNKTSTINQTNFLLLCKITKAEVYRLLHYPFALLIIGITILSPAVGIRLYHPIPSTSSNSYIVSLSSACLGNLVLSGALIGAIGFALLTAVTLNRDKQAHIDSILEATLPPYYMVVSRVFALLILVLLSQGITLLLWLPYTVQKMTFHFRFDWYLQFYLIVMLPALFFAVLLIASIYQIVRHFELSLFCFAAVTLLSLTIWYSKWLIRWINPPISSLSDDFGNDRLFLTLCYNRLFLFLFTTGLFFTSFLWYRRYHKNGIRSIPYNLQKWLYPAFGVFLLLLSGFCYIYQPFFDHSGFTEDADYSYSQTVFWDSISAEITPDTSFGRISGKAIYRIKNTGQTEEAVIFLINPGLKIKSVLWGETPISFQDLNNDSSNKKEIELTIPALSSEDLTIIWSGFPQEWNILSAMPGGLEISSDYLYLLGPTLLPQPKSFLNPSRSDSAVEITIALPSGITPVFFGGVHSAEIVEETNKKTIWHITNSNPYIYLYGGNYISQSIDIEGSPVQFYYSRIQKDLMDEYQVGEQLKQVFLYCSSHYGHLQFEGENGLSLIEILSIGGGYAGKGSSVMGEDSFYRQNFEDALKGSSGGEVLAHEIIHQWWGLGNMFAYEYSDGWSSEGLTVYTTYRLMKELYGADYAKEHYITVWKQEVADYYQNFYIRHPEYWNLLPTSYQDFLNSSFHRIRQYCEMPLKILKAEELVGGEEAMDQILSRLFQREIDPSYPYLTYDDFLNACNLTREDLNIELTNLY